jgi:hypothetical protein
LQAAQQRRAIGQERFLGFHECALRTQRFDHLPQLSGFFGDGTQFTLSLVIADGAAAEEGQHPLALGFLLR